MTLNLTLMLCCLQRIVKRILLSVCEPAVLNILKEEGKEVAEIAGIKPNPTVHMLNEGIQIARVHKAEFILAVGGGSVVDYSKALSVSIHCEEDPWEEYYARFEEPACKIVPVGVVLTMVGTGSE